MVVVSDSWDDFTNFFARITYGIIMFLVEFQLAENFFNSRVLVGWLVCEKFGSITAVSLNEDRV